MWVIRHRRAHQQLSTAEQVFSEDDLSYFVRRLGFVPLIVGNGAST